MMKPPPQEQEEDEERLRQRKLEEALEVKSLRRIISAYRNYPDAVEEDVKRYERSFRKLPPSHKALLSHYPLKFQSLRRCISINSYFIFNMLQAFEPPLDMSQDIDDCGELHFEKLSNDRNVCSHESTAARGSCSKPDVVCCGEPSNVMSKHAEGPTANEELQVEGCHGSDTGSCLEGEDNNKMAAECCGNHVSDSNGNVPSSPREWLDPSHQFHVPLVDVDKVRCIIRNIVRDWAAEGQKERDQCYKPIVEELNSLFPNRCNKSPPTCLVPGAGLGRLALEISCMGPRMQGNGPYILGSIAIAIHFQTVTNSVLFHFQIFIQQDMYGQEDEMSIELILEDVKSIAFNYGFEVENETTIETTYSTNPRSMMQDRYFAAFWTMRKKSVEGEKHST
ncbi:hypothetical protein DKX38_023518 [Salix brachista]|uniref:Uncharacterized protein n=1 Tax=Salix brachista TaxID=2182728 RepID=A0A5N5JJ25_9ROSI|nr:hypothetical protein DKX38_023518 [Salix brachista]